MSNLDLPYLLWEEVSSTSIYVQNRSSHIALGDKTLEEAFTSENLEVGHLRIFGCPIYIHVLEEKRMKMEPSGKKGTFVGYSETTNDYCIYVQRQRYIEVNKYVILMGRKPFDNP